MHRGRRMKVIGFDHLVVNTRNADRALAFYRDVLGLEILREEEYRAGKVGFASVRITPETIIDVRPLPSDEKFVKNVDHICVRIAPTDMERMKGAVAGLRYGYGRRYQRALGRPRLWRVAVHPRPRRPDDRAEEQLPKREAATTRLGRPSRAEQGVEPGSSSLVLFHAGHDLAAEALHGAHYLGVGQAPESEVAAVAAHPAFAVQLLDAGCHLLRSP